MELCHKSFGTSEGEIAPSSAQLIFSTPTGLTEDPRSVDVETTVLDGTRFSPGLRP